MFECTVCGKQLSTQKGLNGHMQMMHPALRQAGDALPEQELAEMVDALHNAMDALTQRVDALTTQLQNVGERLERIPSAGQGYRVSALEGEVVALKECLKVTEDALTSAKEALDEANKKLVESQAQCEALGYDTTMLSELVNNFDVHKNHKEDVCEVAKVARDIVTAVYQADAARWDGLKVPDHMIPHSHLAWHSEGRMFVMMFTNAKTGRPDAITLQVK